MSRQPLRVEAKLQSGSASRMWAAKTPALTRATTLLPTRHRDPVQRSFEIEGSEVFEQACKIGLEGVASKVFVYASGAAINESRRPAQSTRP